MKLFLLTVFILAHLVTLEAKPVVSNAGANFLGNLHLLAKKGGMSNIRSILRTYVKRHYPNKTETQYKRMLKTLVHKIRGKILWEIRKKNTWQAKDDMLARML